MLFGGLTVSVAGLVVAAFWVLRSDDWGRAILGRRVWRRVTVTALLVLAAVSYFRPVDFSAGLTAVVDTMAREARERTEPLLRSVVESVTPTTTTSTSTPLAQPD